MEDITLGRNGREIFIGVKAEFVSRYVTAGEFDLPAQFEKTCFAVVLHYSTLVKYKNEAGETLLVGKLDDSLGFLERQPDENGYTVIPHNKFVKLVDLSEDFFVQRYAINEKYNGNIENEKSDRFMCQLTDAGYEASERFTPSEDEDEE